MPEKVPEVSTWQRALPARTRFEELNADLFKKTLGPVQRVCLLCY